MSLRRFAHENNTVLSPRSIDDTPNGTHHSPLSGPSTTNNAPRTRKSFGLHRSPADTPSISSSIPFDWEAARSRAPPPYSTPLKSRARQSVGTSKTSNTRKAVVRKKGILEKIRSIPSRIAFEIALFPNNIPLPTPKISARILGGVLHFLNFWILASHDNDDGWDSISGVKNTSWFDWSTPISLLLFTFSLFNAYNLALRTRTYKFHHKIDPLASPHAKFVIAKLDLEPVAQPSFSQRLRSNLWFAFSYSWRWLLGMQPPSRGIPQMKEKTTRVQELYVWDPTELELELFSIYSPAHALIWLGMGSSYWMLSLLVMILLSFQMNGLIQSYNILLKDRQLVAAEAMREYNDVFVYPRVNPIRRDVAVMTHQSEVVNIWEHI